LRLHGIHKNYVTIRKFTIYNTHKKIFLSL
jgi:hypothetical protein